jgi:HEPN domain-containing protein
MTPEQLRHEEARAWLDRARRDLRAAGLLAAGDANAEALFHCQQAVEKALKAFLTFHERAFRKTHDLSDLSPECLAIDDSLQSAVSHSEGLT